MYKTIHDFIMKRNELNINFLTIFLASSFTLALQIAITRILSVVIGYQLAFFCISLAMLGMTVGSVYIYINNDKFFSDSDRNFSKSFSYFGISILVCLLILGRIKIAQDTITLIFHLSIVSLSIVIPFFFSGIIVSGLLTKPNISVGKMYFFDLLGAALSCLLVLLSLNLFSVPTFILLLAVLSSITAFLFYSKLSSKEKKISLSIFALAIVSFLSSLTPLSPFYLRYVKGLKIERNKVAIEKWNSFSHISMMKPGQMPGVPGPMWGPSSKFPTNLKDGTIYHFFIDGEAGTGIVEYKSLKDLEYLRYDVVNIAHRISEKNQACIIGVGSGRDIHSAFLYDYKKILAVEINPIFINILKNENLDIAKIANDPRVSLQVDDGRAFYSNAKNLKCDLLMMSLIDTWASTGAGAMTLTENNLYTSEAWKIFLSRLSPNGIFTVSRWYNPNHPEETGKTFTLAASALYNNSNEPVGKNIIILGTDILSTILVKNQPFSEVELEEIKREAELLGFKILYMHGDSNSLEIFQKIGNTTDENSLRANLSNITINLEPTKDENPYFFNLIGVNSLSELITLMGRSSGVVSGNLKAMFLLLILLTILILFSGFLILLPLFLHAKEKPNFLSIFYFFGIGAGFILFEIGLIQRISLILGRPEYALGVVLAGIIFSLGIGSLLSAFFSDLHLIKSKIFIGLSFSLFLIIFYSTGISAFTNYLMELSLFFRILITLLLILPIGILLGFGFPLGMRLIAVKFPNSTPWLWAINGIAGVTFSVVAVMISMYAGISYTFYSSAFIYFLAGTILISNAKK